MAGIGSLEYRDVAKTIDHSLLRPELDLATVREGVELALRYDVASATVRPADVAWAAELVAGSDVLISTVVGFPHGSHTTRTKAAETAELVAAGADEIDMVLNIGRLISGEDDYVEADIRAVVEAAAGRLVKVILENAYLDDRQKIRACELTAAAGAGFVKTSTGFAPTGATIEDLGDAFPGLAHPRVPGALLTLPHRHGTDGFFVARLRKRYRSERLFKFLGFAAEDHRAGSPIPDRQRSIPVIRRLLIRELQIGRLPLQDRGGSCKKAASRRSHRTSPPAKRMSLAIL